MLIKNWKYRCLINKMNELHQRPFFSYVRINSISETETFYKKMINQYTYDMNVIEQQCKISSICHKGCDYCCQQCISISAPEGLLISRALERMSYKERAEVKRKNDIILKKMAEMEIPTTAQEFIKNIDRYSKMYFSMHLQCPFNSEEGECKIYDVRPIVCWQYRSYGTKNECKEKINPKYALPTHVNEYLQDALYRRTKKFIKEDGMFLLPQFLKKKL